MKPGSKAWKNFMAKLYGIGAAVVIIGAMFKIQHWPFASVLLVVGLSTEAVIFFFSAFEPIHEEPDWSLVYPELGLPEDQKKSLQDSNSKRHHGVGGGGSGVAAQLDGMLEDAKIDSDLIASLGDGMRTFSSNAKQMADVTSAASASTSYAENLKDASDKVSKLASTYEAASASLTGLTSYAEQGSSAGAHLQKMTENLSALNSMYEIQIEEMAKTRTMYADMGALVQNLADSVEDTKLYKENISELSKNLKSLNTIYANMLNAMGSARQ
ncbi:MAG: gliding motility protein GldL [Bacteroidota bacterium]